jgi:nitroimidazol reductase NimA-like FMN-containing flavoprotein (pyridoxamine 5'-phosphate oxidase superfamily)
LPRKRETPRREERIRTFGVEEGIGMTEAEAQKFLAESRIVLKLGTVDAKGDPYVHPVWYLFEPSVAKLYIFTGKQSKKLQNIRKRHRVYFDVDDVAWPYKGVKGKGFAREVTRKEKTVALVHKIMTRYIKNRNHPNVTGHVDGARKGVYSAIEITPKYFSTWDYGKLPYKYRNQALKGSVRSLVSS